MRHGEAPGAGTPGARDQIDTRRGTGTSRVQGSHGGERREEVDGPRAGGLHRITVERTTRVACLGCGYEMDNTGAAASHARSKRHAVRVEYSTVFAFVPAERLADVLGGGGR